MLTLWNSELNIVLKTFCFQIAEVLWGLFCLIFPTLLATDFGDFWVSHSPEDFCSDLDVKTATFITPAGVPGRHGGRRSPRWPTWRPCLPSVYATATSPGWVHRYAVVRGFRWGGGGGGGGVLCCHTRSPLHRGCCLLAFNSLPPPAARPLLHPSVITCLQERSEVMPSAPRRQEENAVVTKCPALCDGTFSSHLNWTCTEIVLPPLHILLHFTCGFHRCHTKIIFGCRFTWNGFFLVP